jgi:hypothetical protein
MKIGKIIKRIFIGIIVFFVAMTVFGFILQKTGYEPTTKTAPEAGVSEAETEPAQATPSAGVPKGYEPIDPAIPDVPVDIIRWDIAPLVPMPIGNAKRYEQKAVVYQRLTKEQLEKLADWVYEDTKKKVDFNALVVRFYDYPEFFDYEVRLGQVVYAPNGEWSNAAKVKPGNYKKLKKRSELFEPNWANALTREEAVVIKDYLALNRQYIDEQTAAILAGLDYPNPDEKAAAKTAGKHRMGIAAMQSLVKKFYNGYR